MTRPPDTATDPLRAAQHILGKTIRPASNGAPPHLVLMDDGDTSESVLHAQVAIAYALVDIATSLRVLADRAPER